LSVLLHDYVLQICEDDFDCCIAESYTNPINDDITLDQALVHPLWKASMDDEYKSLQKNNTYDLVQLPPGKRTISARWIFKTKPSLPRQPPRLKYVL
jgi:hypothetical protein